MYSGSNNKRLALAALLLCLGLSAARAQFAQIPLAMLEDTMHSGFFSHVPKAEFHRVFQNFARERYPGQNWIYEMQVQEFTRDFALYASSNAATVAAWKRYAEADRAAKEKAAAEKAKQDAAAAAERAAAEKIRQEAAAEKAKQEAAARAAKLTHRLTAAAKLYTAQDFGAGVAASLARGTLVELNEYGEYTDLDGETAKWARVTTEDGKSGWVFSGFLENKPR